MNSQQDHPPAGPEPVEAGGSGGTSGTPTHWAEAICTLLSTRLAIFQLESRDVARGWVKKAIFIGIGIFCLLSAWLCLLAGGIAALAHFFSQPWYWIALIVSLAHLLLALVFLKISGSPMANAFTHTKAEFRKDRAWIETLNKNRTSSN
ncbi:MAG: phage holin family protein [Luteolibacter sp.]